VSRIIVPDPYPHPAEPRQAAIQVETADGQRLIFPQVAVAMITPDAIEAIAAAIFRKFNPETPDSTIKTDVASLVIPAQS
jgi:hypothetical protein